MVEQLIRQLCDKLSIVVVTHNMQQAARISHRTGFMYKGSLVEFGETSAFFSNPKEEQSQKYLAGAFG